MGWVRLPRMADDAERTRSMKQRIWSMAVAIGLAGMLMALTGAGPASAHEERKIGKYNVEVGFGDEPASPGDYRAWFIPTAPGPYTFHFTGSIKGQKVDEKFTSSPTTFDEVQDPAKVEFPAKDPTTGQLSARVDRETQRLNASLADARRQASDQAGTARLIAIVGVVVGVLGLAAAGWAVRKRA